MNLEYIINKLIKTIDLKIRLNEKGIGLYVLQTSNEKFLVRIITPHKGNKFNFVIRAEYIECMDKWSNATYSESFKDKNGLLLIIKDLKNMIKHRKKILVKEWDCYSEEYQYDINEKEYEKVLEMRW